MHSLVSEHYVRAQVAERLAACEQGRRWRRWRQKPRRNRPPRPPGRGGGLFGSVRPALRLPGFRTVLKWLALGCNVPRAPVVQICANGSRC
jgi:hypothetical protein